jgi:hypothetical protein
MNFLALPRTATMNPMMKLMESMAKVKEGMEKVSVEGRAGRKKCSYFSSSRQPCVCEA